jgi:hypothetical protein
VSRDDRERALELTAKVVQVGMAETSGVDLDQELPCLGRSELDLLDLERLADLAQYSGPDSPGGRRHGLLALLGTSPPDCSR